MNLIGTPVTERIESAAPPLASPSILVKIRPVNETALLKSSATRTASCRVKNDHACSLLASVCKRMHADIHGIGSRRLCIDWDRKLSPQCLKLMNGSGTIY